MDSHDALKVAEEYWRSAGDVRLDPNVQHLLGGAYAIHGVQQYRGLSIYPRSVVTLVSADGQVTGSHDDLVRVDHIDIIPNIGSEQAAAAAFRHVQRGDNDTCHTPHAPVCQARGYRPRVRSRFAMPSRPTVLSKGPFDDLVQASLVVFADPAARGLAWLVRLHVKSVSDFTIVVAANGKKAGEILECTAVSTDAWVASIYPFSKGEPPRSDVTFPRPVADYPPGIRPDPSFPFRDWVADKQPQGNNVLTRIGTKNAKVPSVTQGSTRRFKPVAGSLEEQAIHAFHVCNFMHDFFSLIGFGERDGNFQQENFGVAGRAGDRLVVSVSKGSGAHMRARDDGGPAEMTLGVWKNDDPPTSGNPTAFDAGVVIHEFAHGVSQRLVSGRLQQDALGRPQGLALGEAWSDYFAITILNFYRGVASMPRRFTFADYASKRPGGTRPHPYDAFPDTVRRLGTKPYDEQHGAGSIFAAGLIRMHETLRRAFGDDDVNRATGQETAWMLVVDSMKQLHSDPSFIDARNALLQSNERLALPRAAEIEDAIRSAFAHFGMGRTASCANTSLTGFDRFDDQP